MTLQRIEYTDPFERPDVEVLVGEEWLPGELKQWVQEDDESWWASCTYHRDHITHSGRFAAELVREDTVDRSYGRSVGGAWQPAGHGRVDG